MFSNRAQNGKMRARWARKRRKTRAWNLARDLERSSPRQRLRKQEFKIRVQFSETVSQYKLAEGRDIE